MTPRTLPDNSDTAEASCAPCALEAHRDGICRQGVSESLAASVQRAFLLWAATVRLALKLGRGMLVKGESWEIEIKEDLDGVK